jgi:glutamate 5-kinase
MNKEKIVIKIGTNFIEENGLEKIVKEISKIRKKNKNIILVSSGAKGFGKKYLEKNKFENYKKLNSKELASIGQILIMNEYFEYFSKENIQIAQVLVTKEINKEVVENLLKHNILPIINGNDADNTSDLMYNDNDSLSGDIVVKMNFDLLAIITDVDGVYDKNPRKNKDAKKIKKMTKITEEILKNSKDVGTENGTGGMYTKLKISEKLIKNNKKVYLTNLFSDLDIFLDNGKNNGTLITK